MKLNKKYLVRQESIYAKQIIVKSIDPRPVDLIEADIQIQQILNFWSFSRRNGNIVFLDLPVFK